MSYLSVIWLIFEVTILLDLHIHMSRSNNFLHELVSEQRKSNFNTWSGSLLYSCCKKNFARNEFKNNTYCKFSSFQLRLITHTLKEYRLNLASNRATHSSILISVANQIIKSGEYKLQ